MVIYLSLYAYLQEQSCVENFITCKLQKTPSNHLNVWCRMLYLTRDTLSWLLGGDRALLQSTVLEGNRTWVQTVEYSVRRGQGSVATPCMEAVRRVGFYGSKIQRLKTTLKFSIQLNTEWNNKSSSRKYNINPAYERPHSVLKCADISTDTQIMAIYS